MRVGILSMQRINNYGSLLQAYALKSMIEAMGHEVGFIDIETGDKSYASNVSINSSGISYENGDGLNLRFKLEERIFAVRIFQQFRHNALGMSDAINTDSSRFDMTVIGSDEVFNYSPACSWGISPQLFGAVQSSRVISYAASCGYAQIEDVLDVHRQELSGALSNLESVSVRDENTRRFVSELGRTDVELNLDPVLIYDFSRELNVLNPKKPLSNILLVYGYTNRFSDRSEIEAIKAYAENNGLATVCVGGWQPWCDKYYYPSPFEVLDLFSRARAVVTDTFHGTVMAAKFNRPLAVFLRNSNNQKLGDLLERVHIEKAAVKSPNYLSNILDSPVDYAPFNKEISVQRVVTEEYLHRNIAVHV